MKRIITSIIILTVLSVMSFCSVAAVDKITNKMLDSIDKVEYEFENNNIEKSSEEAQELEKLWNMFQKYAVLINDLGHSLEITSSIAEISSFAQEGNEELYAACDRAAAQVKMFKDMQTPTFWKIL